MKTLTIKIVMLAFGLTVTACSRERGSQVVTPPTKTGSTGSTDTSTKPDDSKQEEQKDVTNPGGGVVEDDNTLVTPGTNDQTTVVNSSSTCFEELQKKFGSDIVFPAQQLLPKQYEQARAQGANGQAALKTMLMSGSCSKLKANE